MGSYRSRKGTKKRIERQEINFFTYKTIKFLIERSLDISSTNPQNSHDLYVAAQKIARRNRIHIPQYYSILFCKSCQFPFTLKTAKIRLNSRKKQIHYRCLHCNKEQRYGYKKKQKKLGGNDS